MTLGYNPAKSCTEIWEVITDAKYPQTWATKTRRIQKEKLTRSFPTWRVLPACHMLLLLTSFLYPKYSRKKRGKPICQNCRSTYSANLPWCPWCLPYMWKQCRIQLSPEIDFESLWFVRPTLHVQRESLPQTWHFFATPPLRCSSLLVLLRIRQCLANFLERAHRSMTQRPCVTTHVDLCH